VVFDRSLHFWINEGLLTIFFFVVGLEIKREVIVGELASVRKAALPAAGALGGVLLPAGIYYLLTQGTPYQVGWGIPMATDIAFVLTALTILGSRLPPTLTLFLVSLAIVDDLVAVVVIAVFYSSKIYLTYLAAAVISLLLLVVINVLGVRRPLPYFLLGAVVWYFTYLSGLHATIAGVAVAFTIPCRSDFDTHSFCNEVNRTVGEFKPLDRGRYHYALHENNQGVVHALEEMCQHVEPPLQRLEHAFHPWVAFAIIPLFALANAGVVIDGPLLAKALTGREALGIILGLFVGKQVGIFAASWLAVKSGLAEMPAGLSFKHLYGGAILCGIGFTMSLFIAELSFPDPAMLASAKVSIFIASVLSLVVGMVVLYGISKGRPGVLRP
jgi:NhaA family Na+:H+ antiporter